MLGISSGSVPSIVKDKWKAEFGGFLHQNITLARTDLSVHEFLWGEDQNDCPSKCFLLIMFSAVVNSVFPRTQDGIKRKVIKWHHHNSSKITGCTCRVSSNALPRMFSMVAQLRGSLYVMPRKLLQRGWYWSEGKCCCFEGIHSVWKLSTPHTFPKFTTYN
jgi:hypothetical protein